MKIITKYQLTITLLCKLVKHSAKPSKTLSGYPICMIYSFYFCLAKSRHSLAF